MTIFMKDKHGNILGRFKDGTPPEQIASELKLNYSPESKKFSRPSPNQNGMTDTLLGSLPNPNTPYGKEAMFGLDQIGRPENKPTLENIKDKSLGSAQGLANIPSDTANTAIKFGNYLNQTDAPTLPRFHFAPENAAARQGEILSSAIPLGGALKGASSLAEIVGGAGKNVLGPVVRPVANVAGKVGKATVVDPVMGLKNMIQSLVTPLREEQKVANMYKTHDAMKAEGSAGFETAKSETQSRGAKIDVDPKVLDKAHKYLGDTDEANELIAKARAGDYDALHQIQSDIAAEGRTARGHDKHGERLKGKSMIETSDKINASIRDSLKKSGHVDLADLIDKSRDTWRKLHETYYKHPTTAKMFGENREPPANIPHFFGKKSDRLKAFREAHPESVDLAKHYANRKKALWLLGKGTGLGIGGDLLYEHYMK